MNIGNRVLWTVIGFVLTAVGVLGILVSFGRLPGAHSESPLVWPALLDRWRDLGAWGPAAVVVLGLLVALLGFLLLRAQWRPGGTPMPDLVLAEGTTDTLAEGAQIGGTTRVRTGVLANGLAQDLSRHPDIRRASAHIIGDQRSPELVLRLTVDPDTDLAALHRHVADAVRRFVKTTDLAPGRVDVTTKLTDREPERVR